MTGAAIRMALELRRMLVVDADASVADVYDDQDEAFQKAMDTLVKEACELLTWGDYRE